MGGRSTKFDFTSLVVSIRRVHEHCVAQAGKAVNISLTLRNWAIGFYIREYEQRGADRASYGEKLLERLAEDLQRQNMDRTDTRELRRYRQFYSVYPGIWESLTPELRALLPSRRTQGAHTRESMPPEWSVDSQKLVSHLSFTHLTELAAIDDTLKRAFYEIECMRGNWTVRELKRQIAALYFERTGLSNDNTKLATLVQANAENAEPRLAIRDPYVFEFLGLKAKEVMGESDLEDELLEKLQDFLLELGHGFCFEARQKRILIGETHGFVDLVFYHRILKCHVLIELKLAEFSHEHMGQLNTYVSWYKRHMMTPGDNQPIGILLCTRKDHALVEYALADLPNRLFVAKYQLELPSREQIQNFIESQLTETGRGYKRSHK